ncbi:MAG: hypothetical protein AB1Z38_00465 [Desulfotignum sp.]
MTHEDKGNYAGKHPDRKQDPVIVEKLKTLGQQNQITCAAAHLAASELNMPPSDIGVQMDLMELRLVKCQLGLFGHGSDAGPVDTGIEVPDDLKTRLVNTAREGRISCKDSWDIAREFKISRRDMGAACEKINLRIKPCQLGAF